MKCVLISIKPKLCELIKDELIKRVKYFGGMK